MPRHLVPISFGVCLAAGMQSMDTFLAGIALPNMMGTFSTTLDEISWILTAYLVAVAVFTPLTAWLGRRYGRKRVLLTGIFGFVVASTFAGTSDTLFEIVTARFIQGVFGATLIPVAQQILLDLWPKERHNIALGWFSVGMMVGLIIGPILGGFLTEYYSWRWNFFVNIPGGLTAFTLIFLFVRENKPDPSRYFDLTGFMLLGTALICMQWVLDRGEQLAWFESDKIVIWASVSLCSLYLFIVHIVTARRPFVDPALFRNRTFTICACYLILLGIMMFGFIALFPALLQNYLGYPVMTSGLILTPRGLATMVAAVFVGHVLARVGPELDISVGKEFIHQLGNALHCGHVRAGDIIGILRCLRRVEGGGSRGDDVGDIDKGPKFTGPPIELCRAFRHCVLDHPADCTVGGASWAVDGGVTEAYHVEVILVPVGHQNQIGGRFRGPIDGGWSEGRVLSHQRFRRHPIGRAG